jgi:hypothetical protein
MRVEITDDDGADPYFLYLWSVSEEEFHELKTQQRLLVDFASNLIELLQCCLKDSKKIAEEEEKEKKEEDEEDGAEEMQHSQKTRAAGPVPLRWEEGLFLCFRTGK